MTSAEKQTRTEREESCFSRAARAIRRALSRICRDSSPPPPVITILSRPLPEYEEFQPDTEYGSHRPPQSDYYEVSYIGSESSDTESEQMAACNFTFNEPAANSVIDLCETQSEKSSDVVLCPPSQHSSITHELRKRDSISPIIRKKEHKEDSSASTTDSFMIYRPPPGTLTETGMIESRSSTADAMPGVSQDNTREMELHATAGPSTNDDSDACYHREEDDDESPKIDIGAGSLADIKSSFQMFTPDDEDDEAYRFQCSDPGLYRCSVTGLMFHMEGGGDVVYRTVPWNRRLLAQHQKRPAGPLFDIKCVQQSVFQLHLPHCEILSTGGGDFLSVAHVTDEGVEFISPHEITNTHIIINITGFSGFGNVKDEDSPAVPVRALVLLFYKPPADPDTDPESLLNVLLLPNNVVLRDVQRSMMSSRDEHYIKTCSECKLQPNQNYTLSISPEDDSVLVQPKQAEFHCENYGIYIPKFQVFWETMMRHIKLFLRDTNSSNIVWESRISISAIQRSVLNLPPHERLMDIRSSFVKSISGPVLKSLLDKLFERKVITDSERESADEMQNNRDKARSVIDTVGKKGEAASSEMIEFLCETDPHLCEHLGLI